MGNEFVVTLDNATKSSFPKFKMRSKEDRDMLEKIKTGLFRATKEDKLDGSRFCTGVAVEGQENVGDLDGTGGQDTKDLSFIGTLEDNHETISEDSFDEKSIVSGVISSGSCISGVSGLNGLSMNLSALF